MKRILALAAAALPLLAAQPAVAAAAPSRPAPPQKVLVVMFENHSESEGLAQMPKLSAQAKRYGTETDYFAIAHPSLPNYLAITGGTVAGVHDDAEPAKHHVHGPSVFDQALAHGRTATAYAESMPGNCDTVTTDVYAARHNPWVYYSDKTERANCTKHDVPSGTPQKGRLRTDVRNGTLPDVGMLTPNICDDAHNCPLRTADAWLASWLKVIENGPDWKAGRLAVVVTFDEDDYSGPNKVLTVVLDPALHGVKATAKVTHYGLSRWLSETAGATPEHSAARARSLRDVFFG